MLRGAISWANAGFGSARASALVGEGILRCRAEAPSSRGAVEQRRRRWGVGVACVSRVWTVYS